MKCSAERLIEALVAVQMLDYQKQQSEKAKQPTMPPVVTVSRECGSMGAQVAQLLADALEVRCCDRMILQEVARRANVDQSLVKALDQHVSNNGDQLWRKLLHKDTLSYEVYYQNLVKTILSISRTGGVIIGRGANHILGKKAFRVRVTGSLAKCARFISDRDNVDMERATEMARASNNERAEYIHKLYNADINDPSHYDLVLNSDRFSHDQMVDLVLLAMEKAGFSIPNDNKEQ